MKDSFSFGYDLEGGGRLCCYIYRCTCSVDFITYDYESRMEQSLYWNFDSTKERDDFMLKYAEADEGFNSLSREFRIGGCNEIYGKNDTRIRIRFDEQKAMKALQQALTDYYLPEKSCHGKEVEIDGRKYILRLKD